MPFFWKRDKEKRGRGKSAVGSVKDPSSDKAKAGAETPNKNSNKKTNQSISDLLSDITNDRKNGARVLAEKGLRVLSHALESDEQRLGECHSADELFRELRKIGLRIADARPSMKAAIEARVLRALTEIKKSLDDNKRGPEDANIIDKNENEMESLRRKALQTLEDERRRCENEVKDLVEAFVKYFDNGSGTHINGVSGVVGGGVGHTAKEDVPINLLTLSSSSTLASCLVELINGRGRRVNLTVLESRPMYAGVWLARDVLGKVDADKRENLELKIAVDSAVGILASKPGTVVAVGCDRLSHDGRVLNALGTLAAALVAKASGNKMLVVAETAKISSDGNRVPGASSSGEKDETEEENDPKEVHDGWSLEGQPFETELRDAAANRYFEWTDADLVTAYVTEIGVIKKEKIEEIAQDFAELEREMFQEFQ